MPARLLTRTTAHPHDRTFAARDRSRDRGGRRLSGPAGRTRHYLAGMKVLVTGAAGFIGSHVALRLLGRGDDVVGLDSFSDYYDVQLKRDRISLVREAAAAEGAGEFQLVEGSLADRSLISDVIIGGRFDRVIHLAAQAGVRHSLTHPHDYIDTNLAGFANVLEGCRHAAVPHLTYASSSSVYGANTTMPFAVGQTVDHPLSLYAATKKANELMAHAYSHLYRLPTTGLRFFTVYGPWGRPDMAMWIFADRIRRGLPIDVFNEGRMQRDFTFVDDIAEGVVRTSDAIAQPDLTWDAAAPNPSTSSAPWRLYNIGNNKPTELMHVIELIERHVGRRAEMTLLPMQPGDVPATFADVDSLEEATGFRPHTSIEEGVAQFLEWFLAYTAARDVASGSSSIESDRVRPAPVKSAARPPG